ncbi:hypothetical protein AS593_15500 [Caulobacter vibrioides]|nr:hypothetical protein AS593_15500 [Caulobacter vibrioides]
MLLSGTTPPTPGDGADGDFWINTTAWMIYGPKAAGAWPAGVDLIPANAAAVAYDDALTQLGAANVQEAIVALFNRLPVLTNVTLSSGRYLHDAPASTVIADIIGWMPGAVLSLAVGKGRFEIVGNPQEGFKLVKGDVATPAGDAAIVIRQTFPAARNGPTHDTAITLMAMAADRYMLGVTRVRVNSGAVLAAVAGVERKMSVFVYGAPQYATNGYRIHYAGFASTEGGNSPQETVLPGNDTVIHGAWAVVGVQVVNGALVGGTRHRLKFGGLDGATIASGANGAWTDEANFVANLAAEGNLAIVTEYSTAVGQNQLPNARIQKHRGERIWGGPAGASLAPMLDALGAASTAALDTSYGLIGQPQFYGPDLIVQKGWDGRPVILAMADSIGESRQEFSGSADARGNLGELRRWLDIDDATYRRTPHYVIGVPGAASVRELATSAFKRWDNLDQAMTWNGGTAPFTRIVDQLAQNDLQTSFTTMRSYNKGAVTRVKARYPGLSVVAFGALPRTSSTDFYVTRANQTRVTGNEWATPTDVWGNGNKWQLEAAREAGLDGELSGYISTRPYWYDATYPGTWPVATATTLFAQAGTDGTATYSQIVVTDRPAISDVIRWGAGNVGVGFAVDVVADPGGGWRVTLDRSTNTIVAAAGSPVITAPTNDQVHPQPSPILAIAAAVPQSEKAKLA